MSSKALLPDSSVWIEILGEGPLAKPCQKKVEAASACLVPTLVLFEVYRKIAQTVSEDQALSAVAVLSQNKVLPLTTDIALGAADLSIQHKLATVDSLMLAHAQAADATFLTLDNDFAGIDGVQVLRS